MEGRDEVKDNSFLGIGAAGLVVLGTGLEFAGVDVLKPIGDFVLMISDSKNREYAFLMLLFLGSALLAINVLRSQRKTMEAQLVDFTVALKGCEDKHQEQERIVGNMRISLSALWTYCVLSGDRRLASMDFDDLLAGKVVLKILPAVEGETTPRVRVVATDQQGLGAAIPVPLAQPSVS